MAFHHGDLDPDTADRLLAGRLDPDDAPSAFRGVARLLQAARTHEGHKEVEDDAVIFAMVDVINTGDLAATSKGTGVLTRLVTVKAAAITAALLAVTATGAGAMTGNLPEAAQDGLARAAEHIGINLPDSADDRAPAVTEEPGREVEDPEGDAAVDDGAVVPRTAQEDDGAVATDPEGGSGVPAGNHGDVVSDAAQNADPEGGKGEEVAPVAREDHGTGDRPPSGVTPPSNPHAGAGASNGQGNGNGGGQGNGNANGGGQSNGAP